MADSGEFALVTSRPGKTCLSALRHRKSFGELACNDSTGCGGVMRVAPHALFPAPFELAAESAHHRITPKGTQLGIWQSGCLPTSSFTS
ncbi:ADP-ribosylglycohydrolase family protein [Pseudomonas sp.]|uniref:ADP-ribosylglycohydrolase family protein n=1 Tax=Pseudomonas sp. TaxID=306 RepID=UPI0039AF5136